jgi:hypothetical protein
MNTRKSSTLKTFIEYLGRGATPVDGYYWVEPRRESEPKNATAASRASALTPHLPHLGKCAPAARGT